MNGVQTMKIFSILSKIEQLVSESPKPRFNNAGSRRIIDEEELIALLDDLKATIPEDIRRASGIIAEKENTLRDANEQADQIVADAQKEANELHEQAQEAAENVYRQAVAEYEALVQQESVYQEAMKRADDLHRAAEENADSICNGARAYADDILSDVQRYLNDYMKMINGNREELDVRRKPVAPELEIPEPDPNRLAAKISEPRREPVRRPEPVQQPRPVQPAPVEEEDEEEEAPQPKPRKKGFFARMLGIEEVEEDDEDDYEEEEAPAPKKKRRGFFSFSDNDDEEE